MRRSQRYFPQHVIKSETCFELRMSTKEATGDRMFFTLFLQSWKMSDT
jgi:hypothetical protein